MAEASIFQTSDALAGELTKAVPGPLAESAPRFVISDVACSLALEHWHATRLLLQARLLPSAAVVHRAHFEALTRAVWLLYAASDAHLEKLADALSLDAEQAAKNMPQLGDMLRALAPVAPPPVVEALTRFRTTSWQALNSYAHAGLHPLKRHHEGYPPALLENVLRNANGLGLLACMQAAVLSGDPSGQAALLAIARRYSACLPPPP